jgi:hypothetical protein
MAKELNDTQRQWISDAIDILSLPTKQEKEASSKAEKFCSRFVYSPRTDDRDTVKGDLKSDATKLIAASKVLRRRLTPRAARHVYKYDFPDGILPEEHPDEALADILMRKAEIRREAAENLSRRSRGPKEAVDKDQVWAHTLDQFENYRPKALKRDKEAYATLILQVKTGIVDNSWRDTSTRYNKRRKEENSKS